MLCSHNFSKSQILRDSQSFFAMCFQSADSRPGAEVLLAHPFLSSTPHLSAEEKSAIRALVKKRQRDDLSLNLTTDEVSDVALVTLRARASSLTKPLMPSKLQMSSLAKALDVFAITVEDSFNSAILAHENELANYELRGADAEKVKVVTRSERRRRRTYGSGALRQGGLDSSKDVSLDEVQAAMNKAASIIADVQGGGRDLDFKTRAAHAKSEVSTCACLGYINERRWSRFLTPPMQPRVQPPPPTSLASPPDVKESDVSQITADMSKMSAAIESSIDYEEGEVKMISVGEARRRRRRRTFDGKRPGAPPAPREPVPAASKKS